jgi:TonB family protein
MVDPKGKPFEVGVLRSTGNRHFEQLAVKAMEHAKLEPATLNGKPIESVYEHTYRFSLGEYGRLHGTHGAGLKFLAVYKSLQAALTRGDRAAADAAMQQLKVTNLYEDAAYGMAQFLSGTRWSDTAQQEAGAWRGLGGDEYLTPEQRRLLLFTNFKLQVDKHDYFLALEMWKRLQQAGVDAATGAKAGRVIEQIQQLRDGPGSYGMSGIVGETGTWNVHLMKRKFLVEVSAGVVSGVKLKCSRAFVSFPFDPRLQYEVQRQYGNCLLTLEGSPGAQLQLTQA